MSKTLVSLLGLASFFAVLCFSYSANAQPYGIHGWGPHPEIRQRIHRQQEKIARGVASGTLTRHEHHMVQQRLDGIRAEYDAALSRGGVSPREAERLNIQLDENERMIYREKHNPERRYY
jgi:hypothetical protein